MAKTPAAKARADSAATVSPADPEQTVYATSPVVHDNVHHEVGDSITLPQAQAAMLLAGGSATAVAPVEDAPDPELA